jgi:hypothetical protein
MSTHPSWDVGVVGNAHAPPQVLGDAQRGAAVAEGFARGLQQSQAPVISLQREREREVSSQTQRFTSGHHSAQCTHIEQSFVV